ncbi:MAG: hypothetical protein EB127_24695 [Alphaproteobacteria bacterium]|jgi:hypothetical protein|nr:hypothetical protein [Alphaproteobacteria bacterium]
MECNIDLSSCIKNKKEDVIALAFKCKILNSKQLENLTTTEICKEIKSKDWDQLKKLCLIQDV